MLAFALTLDALCGDPEWLWRRVKHPIVLIGKLIAALERNLNSGENRRLKGVAAIVTILVIVLPLPVILSTIPFGWVLEIIGAAVLLAHRSLVEHVLAVADALEISLEAGRTEVAKIVGRDPETLDASDVSRAAIESAAENFSDGVVAPAFWFAIGGFPGLVAYKAINTADSMIGHLTPRYREFGWAAARLDDVLNWLPARMTGYLFLSVAGRLDTAKQMHSDAPRHCSVNAGWPEAAMASTLDLALAGPRIYGGEVTEDPYMNANGQNTAGPADIRRAVRVLWQAWFGLLCIAVAGSAIQLAL